MRGESDHLIELLFRNVTGLFILNGLGETNQLSIILHAVKQNTLGRCPVTTGAACFLVIALHVLWQIAMHNKTDIRFIDPHAEGDGRNDDRAFVTSKRQRAAGPQYASHSNGPRVVASLGC